jgi:hypothetical protein
LFEATNLAYHAVAVAGVGGDGAHGGGALGRFVRLARRSLGRSLGRDVLSSAAAAASATISPLLSFGGRRYPEA